MSFSFKIPRSVRTKAGTLSAGQTVIAFDFKVFDPLDVAVELRLDPALPYAALAADAFTVTLNGAAPNTGFVTLATARPAGTAYKILGRRTHERETDVTLAGAIKAALLEGELDKLTVILQEVRRDLGTLFSDNLSLWTEFQGIKAWVTAQIVTIQGLLDQVVAAHAAAMADIGDALETGLAAIMSARIGALNAITIARDAALIAMQALVDAAAGWAADARASADILAQWLGYALDMGDQEEPEDPDPFDLGEQEA